MHRAPSAALRIAVGAALGLGLYLFAAPSGSGGHHATAAYALDASPTPTPTVIPPGVAPGAPSPAQSPLQQTSDQIASVAQQITQAIQDPSTSTDSKVQLINSLAAQFNQLVAIWQQQLAQTSTAPAANTVPTPATAGPGPMCGTPACAPQPTAPAVAGVQVTPTPPSKPPAP